MESIIEIKEALAARSATTTLDELKTRGKQRVKIIRPEHIAEMIQEAVQRAVESSGLVSAEKTDQLVAQSKREFLALKKEREAEHDRLQTALAELEEARQRVRELEHELTDARSGAGAGTAAAAGSDGLMLKLMREVADMKAQMGRPQAAAASAQGAAGIEAALARIAGSLEERLDKFGQKMGVSSAVEADVDYSGLFKDHGQDKQVESNLDSMKIKQDKAAGIAGNLDKLRKLRGGS